MLSQLSVSKAAARNALHRRLMADGRHAQHQEYHPNKSPSPSQDRAAVGLAQG
jgi:hypothetical protein